MKKLISFIILFSCAALVPAEKLSAQTAALQPLRAGDTLVTSNSLDTVSKVIPVTAGYQSVAIQVNLTELSGTTANAKAYLYRSLDKVNYILTDSSAVFTDITTNSVLFQLAEPAVGSIKLIVRNIGTTATTFSGIVRYWLLYKMHD